MLLLHHVVGTQLQNKPSATALVQIMTCTPSLMHQPGPQDLRSGLPFVPSAVSRIPNYRESCSFFRIAKEDIKNIRGRTKRLSTLIKYMPHMHGYFIFNITLEIYEWT